MKCSLGIELRADVPAVLLILVFSASLASPRRYIEYVNASDAMTFDPRAAALVSNRGLPDRV